MRISLRVSIFATFACAFLHTLCSHFCVRMSLHVTVEHAMSLQNTLRQSKRGPTPKLQQQIERLNRLPKTKQKVVMEIIEGVLSQSR
jgi:hypothetical protein